MKVMFKLLKIANILAAYILKIGFLQTYTNSFVKHQRTAQLTGSFFIIIPDNSAKVGVTIGVVSVLALFLILCCKKKRGKMMLWLYFVIHFVCDVCFDVFFCTHFLE